MTYIHRPPRFIGLSLLAFVGAFVSACGSEVAAVVASGGDGPSGYDRLVELRAEVDAGTVETQALLHNLGNIVHEVDYAACMQSQGIDYELVPIEPPPAQIEPGGGADDWSFGKQELALTEFAPTDDPEMYGLGFSYANVVKDQGTLWTRVWTVEVSSHNDHLYGTSEVSDADSQCWSSLGDPTGWLRTEAMWTVEEAFHDLLYSLSNRLDISKITSCLRDAGYDQLPDEIEGVEETRYILFFHSGLGYSDLAASSGPAWDRIRGEEAALATAYASCRTQKLAAGDGAIGEAVDSFRCRYDEEIPRANADIADLRQVLDEVEAGTLALHDIDLDGRRSWIAPGFTAPGDVILDASDS